MCVSEWVRVRKKYKQDDFYNLFNCFTLLSKLKGHQIEFEDKVVRKELRRKTSEWFVCKFVFRKGFKKCRVANKINKKANTLLTFQCLISFCVIDSKIACSLRQLICASAWASFFLFLCYCLQFACFCSFIKCCSCSKLG